MRPIRVSVLAVIAPVCLTVGLIERASTYPGASATQNTTSLQTAAFSQQGVPVRVPDSSVSKPGSWPQQGTKKKTVDVTKLKVNADELITLSQGLPTQLDQIGNGKLPKDLLDNLRKIEKLSKHMRSELE